MKKTTLILSLFLIIPGLLHSEDREMKRLFENMLDISSDGSIKILLRKNNREETTDYLIITNGDETALFLWAGATG